MQTRPICKPKYEAHKIKSRAANDSANFTADEVMFAMIYAGSSGKIKSAVMTLTIVRLYLIIPFMTLHTIAVITQLNT